MATPPRERDRALWANGLKLLGIGVALAVVGVILAIALSGTAMGIGVAFVSVGSVPAVAGLGMMLTAVVSRRSREGKPFA